MAFSDSHCHLDTYHLEQLVEVLEQARQKQVDIMVSVSMDLESSEAAIKLAQSHDEASRKIGVAEWTYYRWRREYNQVRPHSSLGYRPPAPEAIIPVTLT